MAAGGGGYNDWQSPMEPNQPNYEKEDSQVELGLEFENDDAAWVMACTFIIFTMQTGG